MLGYSPDISVTWNEFWPRKMLCKYKFSLRHKLEIFPNLNLREVLKKSVPYTLFANVPCVIFFYFQKLYKMLITFLPTKTTPFKPIFHFLRGIGYFGNGEQARGIKTWFDWLFNKSAFRILTLSCFERCRGWTFCESIILVQLIYWTETLLK